MAGKGFAPRDKDKMRVVQAAVATQPALPSWHEWHPATVEWWEMWGEFPLAPEFTASDWAFLIDTALLQDAFYRGDRKPTTAGEIRVRVAKFGQTMEDRARLRITFATAASAESRAPRPQPKRRRDRGGVLVDFPTAVGE